MSKGTAPAWQVRDMQRHKLLEGLQGRMSAEAERFPIEWDLYRVLIRLLDTLLFEGSITTPKDLAGIPQEVHNSALGLLREILQDIDRFKRSAPEGRALMAQLLEYAVERLTDARYEALRNDEFAHPKLIFGTDRATDDMPIPD